MHVGGTRVPRERIIGQVNNSVCASHSCIPGQAGKNAVETHEWTPRELTHIDRILIRATCCIFSFADGYQRLFPIGRGNHALAPQEHAVEPTVARELLGPNEGSRNCRQGFACALRKRQVRYDLRKNCFAPYDHLGTAIHGFPAETRIPLQKAFCCLFVRSGSLLLLLRERSLNYCDCAATRRVSVCRLPWHENHNQNEHSNKRQPREDTETQRHENSDVDPHNQQTYPADAT